MSAGLPTQLKWREFVRVVGLLGYVQYGQQAGSARSFKNDNPPAGKPPIVTFHEPHGSATIPLGTLRSYIRKLGISRDEFLTLLNS